MKNVLPSKIVVISRRKEAPFALCGQSFSLNSGPLQTDVKDTGAKNKIVKI